MNFDFFFIESNFCYFNIFFKLQNLMVSHMIAIMNFRVFDELYVINKFVEMA